MDAQDVEIPLHHGDDRSTGASVNARSLMTTNDLLKYARGMHAWLPSTMGLYVSTLPPCAVSPQEPEQQPSNSFLSEPSQLPRCPDGAYDICSVGVAPSTSTGPRAPLPHQQYRAPGGVPRSVDGLPPGVVLLKGYLTMDEQIRIVHEIRELGIGPGGFYIPSYITGGRLWLHMMCMGLHWEPRTNSYETIRSSHDGATPPPIPAWLVELCGRCLAAASDAAVAAGGSRFPPLQPDICLANFYERSGKLGMHQDKDEMPDSLRAGLPVVSLSLGDATDFQYGKSRDIEEASTVRLESGDLLVFGGPGRMIFHSVSKVHPNTAPPELVRATGLRPGRLNLTFRQYRALTGGPGTRTGTGAGAGAGARGKGTS
ncbi:hypothetical protein Vretimale_11035 [Volvox reticuliferus]|uniref:Fe2OG dioxygenase domain-containing protein n=1 Tax=Volvox reticuliferus TaxID=1737510 RepID=A0A8J4CK92_9CHLO|nr:hypothetical protein Vretifemale_12782 [Volvox reticuliferus]GIM06794.1 hypothetical protein Vretimale_11035 [Volvox reticuliferus]